MDVLRSAISSVRSARLRVLLLLLLLAVSVLCGTEFMAGQRPGKHPEFSEGFRAFKKKDWATAADQMQAALDGWGEDGLLTRVYGRWFEPYLPRYYLGAALYELGCYEAALQQLDDSLLSKQEIKGTKKEREELASLKLKADRLVRQGVTGREKADCVKWNEKIYQSEGKDVR